ncbi:MAG: hypothetical protein QOG99_245, partial [Frankiales bacterium]|nr:hypothetical protein [Frankiales bacterium]
MHVNGSIHAPRHRSGATAMTELP